ncbi:MAG: hypothetical protein AAF497_25930, partial [Planctomycetota bacterium]
MTENPYESPIGRQTASERVDEQTSAMDREVWKIKRDANNALMAGWAGFLLCMPFFAAPVAFYLGNRALRSIEELNRGHEYEATAKRAIGMGKLAMGVC